MHNWGVKSSNRSKFGVHRLLKVSQGLVCLNIESRVDGWHEVFLQFRFRNLSLRHFLEEFALVARKRHSGAEYWLDVVIQLDILTDNAVWRGFTVVEVVEWPVVVGVARIVAPFRLEAHSHVLVNLKVSLFLWFFIVALFLLVILFRILFVFVFIIFIFFFAQFLMLFL